MTGGRGRFSAVTAALLCIVITPPATAAWRGARLGPPALDSQTVVVSASGARSLVPLAATSLAVPGSRAADTATARSQQAWLASGSVPGRGTALEPMVRAALLDLHALTLSDGAATAGWSPAWRYVWPRDASFTAVALARTGHLADAEQVLAFLQRVQHPDGTFDARYLPDGSGPPDDRGIELDGSGWVLWATAQIAAAAHEPAGTNDPAGTNNRDEPAGTNNRDDAARHGLLERLRPLVTRATSACLRLALTDDGLPPAAKDYWETAPQVTLGTAAPLLAGLQAAQELNRALGRPDVAARAAATATQLASAIATRFGADGYPRELGGHARDAAVTFLLPPFVTTASRQVSAEVWDAWQRAQREMLRPAGGLAPGAGWKADGISWTPETALFALTAAAGGDRDTALHWLTWLDLHRTALGSLPEKVLADGRPAAVAPLAWTASSVVLAVGALELPLS